MEEKKDYKDKKDLGKEILVNVGPVEKRVAVVKAGKLLDFFLERENIEHYAGSIYKGRITSILPGIEAAFVDIGLEKNGFLHVSDVLDKGAVLKEILPDEAEVEVPLKKGPKEIVPRIENILKKGQEIMVQVVKEAIGTKGPRVTTYISIPGRYVVLTPYDSNIGISRRVVDRSERRRIREILGKIELPKGAGCIVRTVAEGRTEGELGSELRYLTNLWERVKVRAERGNAPLTVYEEYGIVLRILRDGFTEDINELVVDSREEYARIIKFLKSFMPALRRKVKLYTARTPLFQRYNLDKKIDEIFERKVVLPNGGYLIIEQTEGVVVIDVNTGSYVGKRSLEETAFKTNVEAAEEIPRQLMLRDIGGIIIIDFIDMEIKEHRYNVFNHLQGALQDDKARISLRAISQFGIVEMTRQRMHKSIESSSYVECPYCSGKGTIKSVATIAIEVARRIDEILARDEKRHKHISITLHPDVNAALISNQAKILSDIQRKYRCKLDLKEDKMLHIEDIIIVEH